MSLVAHPSSLTQVTPRRETDVHWPQERRPTTDCGTKDYSDCLLSLLPRTSEDLNVEDKGMSSIRQMLKLTPF